MADVNISYDAVQGVSSQLNNAVNNIVPQLQNLQNQVNGMLSQGGSLWMNQTSPALQNSYQQFNTSLNQAVNGINDFATQFTSITGQMQSMDQQMANSINNPSSN
jgi:uncharacterized protein YukE